MPAGWNRPYRRAAGTHVDDDGNRHRRRNAIVVDGNRLYTLRDRRAMHANPALAWRAMPRSVAGPIAGLAPVAIMVITVLLCGYMGAVGAAAVYVMPHPRLFGIGWRVLQALTVVLVPAARAWSRSGYRRHRADIMGARRAAGIIHGGGRARYMHHTGVLGSIQPVVVVRAASALSRLGLVKSAEPAKLHGVQQGFLGDVVLRGCGGSFADHRFIEVESRVGVCAEFAA